MEESFFWVPDRAPTGCGFAMLSYNGIIKTTFMVDKALINDDYEVSSSCEKLM